MVHAYAPDLWRLYGVPFDRVWGLDWWDLQVMCVTVDAERRSVEREHS